MTFLCGLKASVKPLFCSASLLITPGIKISNYKVYDENPETTYDLPKEWENKENSQEYPKSNEMINVRPPQRTSMEAAWHRRDKIDAELTNEVKRDLNLRQE
ncbi:hypothetical protein EVAR_9244_1 [Eumeta japonica]|uniref:Uncharacterized protein n=1 Tax=Eumeta variegata TaxID=151549 RepID=A0A4C1TMI1_EUMVA|nr:hypothetical protein EVAR_9244_1 [Eumeta japonica]